MKTILALTAMTLAGVLAGCAANPGAGTASARADRGPDACFRTGLVVNVNRVNDQTVYVATERGYVFRVDMPSGFPATGVVGAFSSNVETCNGSQVRVGAGTMTSRPMLVCLAQITGPYTDSRETGLWARPVAP